MRCSDIRGKQKQGDELKCCCCAIQDADTVEECQGIKLNIQSFEAVEFCYLAGTIGTRGGAVNSNLERMNNRVSLGMYFLC